LPADSIARSQHSGCDAISASTRAVIWPLSSAHK
jgi:hypothetical protein